MKKVLFSILLLLIIILVLGLAKISLAAADIKLQLQVPISGISEMTITGSSFGQYIKAAYEFGSSAIVVLAIVMIMSGGVKWIFSGGDSGKIGEAKDTILKAALGLFIAIFAIFMLQIVSPGTTNLKSLSPEEIVGLECCQMGSTFTYLNVDACTRQKGKAVAPNLCLMASAVAKCADDLTHPCAKEYEDTFGNPCIGKDCTSAGGNKICGQVNNAWSCIDCKKSNEACTGNRECCSGSCTKELKCTDLSLILAYLGNSCNSNANCTSPLICETNNGNTCSFGRQGNDCSRNEECNGSGTPVFFCDTIGRNFCNAVLPYAKCKSKDTCPPGYECQDPTYCTQNGNPNVNCKNWATSKSASNEICIQAGNCVCDCSSDNECQEVIYKDGIKSPKCQTNGYNFCGPGTYGSPCQGGQCIGYCNTYGQNMCTQGEVGDSCAGDNECRPQNTCYKNFCVPRQ